LHGAAWETPNCQVPARLSLLELPSPDHVEACVVASYGNVDDASLMIVLFLITALTKAETQRDGLPEDWLDRAGVTAMRVAHKTAPTPMAGRCTS
jgi:hypothetical protein